MLLKHAVKHKVYHLEEADGTVVYTVPINQVESVTLCFRMIRSPHSGTLLLAMTNLCEELNIGEELMHYKTYQQITYYLLMEIASYKADQDALLAQLMPTIGTA